MNSLFHTITADIQLQNATYPQIDDTQEALILLLELLLVEDLYSEDTVIGRLAAVEISPC